MVMDTVRSSITRTPSTFVVLPFVLVYKADNVSKENSNQGRLSFGVGDTLNGPLNIFGGDRPTVVEFGVFPEVEGIGLSAVADLPILG